MILQNLIINLGADLAAEGISATLDVDSLALVNSFGGIHYSAECRIPESDDAPITEETWETRIGGLHLRYRLVREATPREIGDSEDRQPDEIVRNNYYKVTL